MKLEYILNKIKKNTNINDIKKYENDLKKLVEAHNSKKINLYNKINLISYQISINLDNIYYRIMESIKYKRDSSSLEVCKLKYGDSHGLEKFLEKTSKCKHNLEKYIKKYGDVDGPVKYKQYCKSKSMSYEMCVKRHGHIKGPIIFKEYWENTGFGVTETAFRKRHGDSWELYYERYKKNRKKFNTLEYKIIKYGETEGPLKYNEFRIKKSKSQSKENHIKKMLNNGACYQQIQDSILNRWSHTSLNSFILKYGDIDGKLKYEEHIKKCKESNPICLEYDKKRNISDEEAFLAISKIQFKYNKKISRFSEESLKYFNKLNSIFENRGYNCKYKNDELSICLNIDEYNIYKKNRIFFYDFFIPELNSIIEYHGVRFHDDIDYNSTLGVTKKDLLNMEYNKDFYKKWLAEYRGYNVFIIRSWKLKEDLENIINFFNFTEDEKCKLI